MTVKTESSTGNKSFKQINNWIKTPINEHFERITTLAKTVFSVAVVGISINDRRLSLQTTLGVDQLLPEQLELLHRNFDNETIVVKDTLKDNRFNQDPLFQGNRLIRFYINAPICEKGGKRIGKMVLIGFKPQKFDLLDESNLNDIINLAEKEVNNYQLSLAQRMMLEDLDDEQLRALTDETTKTWTSNGFAKLLDYQVKESKKEQKPFACAVINIDNFAKLNQQYGENIGDNIIKATARQLVRSCRDNDSIARHSEHDFVVLINTEERENIMTVAKRIHDNLKNIDMFDLEGNVFNFHVTMGLSIFNPQKDDAESVMMLAKGALVTGKNAGKNCIQF